MGHTRFKTQSLNHFSLRLLQPTKSTKSFPFNIISSSLNTGYQKQVQSEVTGNINIVNLHNDVYGPHMEKPLHIKV